VTEAYPLITVVDDDASVRNGLRRLLHACHYGVQAFGSAEEFLASPGAGECACAIVDVRMPGMDGIELQDRLAVSRPKLPVIIMTGHDDPAMHARAAQGGAIAVLHKPISQKELMEAIHEALTGAVEPTGPHPPSQDDGCGNPQQSVRR
jgi:FixJ family two-component response regulator